MTPIKNPISPCKPSLPAAAWLKPLIRPCRRMMLA